MARRGTSRTRGGTGLHPYRHRLASGLAAIGRRHSVLYLGLRTSRVPNSRKSGSSLLRWIRSWQVPFQWLYLHSPETAGIDEGVEGQLEFQGESESYFVQKFALHIAFLASKNGLDVGYDGLLGLSPCFTRYVASSSDRLGLRLSFSVMKNCLLGRDIMLSSGSSGRILDAWFVQSSLSVMQPSVFGRIANSRGGIRRAFSRMNDNPAHLSHRKNANPKLVIGRLPDSEPYSTSELQWSEQMEVVAQEASLFNESTDLKPTLLYDRWRLRLLSVTVVKEETGEVVVHVPIAPIPSQGSFRPTSGREEIVIVDTGECCTSQRGSM